MPQKTCQNCNEVVTMRKTPQTNREWCPECGVINDYSIVSKDENGEIVIEP